TLGHEGVGVDGRGKVVVLAVRSLGVEEAELGERVQSTPAQARAVAAELSDHRFGLLGEALVEPVPPQGLLALRAQSPGREHAAGCGAVDVLCAPERHADRRRTRRTEQDQSGEDRSLLTPGEQRWSST